MRLPGDLLKYLTLLLLVSQRYGFIVFCHLLLARRKKVPTVSVAPSRIPHGEAMELLRYPGCRYPVVGPMPLSSSCDIYATGRSITVRTNFATKIYGRYNRGHNKTHHWCALLPPTLSHSGCSGVSTIRNISVDHHAQQPLHLRCGGGLHPRKEGCRTPLVLLR